MKAGVIPLAALGVVCCSDPAAEAALLGLWSCPAGVRLRYDDNGHGELVNPWLVGEKTRVMRYTVFKPGNPMTITIRRGRRDDRVDRSRHDDLPKRGRGADGLYTRPVGGVRRRRVIGDGSIRRVLRGEARCSRCSCCCWSSVVIVRSARSRAGCWGWSIGCSGDAAVNYRQLKQTACGASLSPLAMLRAPRVAPTPNDERWSTT